MRREQRKFPRHYAYVKTFPCAVRGCPNRPSDFAHLRSAANSGMGLKPADYYGVPLCRRHHMEQHRVGQRAFEKQYMVNLWQLAEWLATKTPDAKMREYLRG